MSHDKNEKVICLTGYRCNKCPHNVNERCSCGENKEKKWIIKCFNCGKELHSSAYGNVSETLICLTPDCNTRINIIGKPIYRPTSYWSIQELKQYYPSLYKKIKG